MVNVYREHTLLYFGIIFIYLGNKKINSVLLIMSLCLMITIPIFAPFCHHCMTTKIAYLHSEGKCCCKSVSIPCTLRGRVLYPQCILKMQCELHYAHSMVPLYWHHQESIDHKMRGKKSSHLGFHQPILGPIIDDLLRFFVSQARYGHQ